MFVEIKSIDQKLDLDTHKVTSHVTIKLPNGELIQAILDESGAEVLLTSSMQSKPPQRAPVAEEQVYEEHDLGEQQETQQVEEDVIDWTTLPSSVLSDEVKAILTRNHVPSVLTDSQFSSLIEEVSTSMIQSKNTVSQERLGVVKSLKGRPMKSAPKDANGYPIMAATDDSKDVDVDEDGVAQA